MHSAQNFGGFMVVVKLVFDVVGIGVVVDLVDVVVDVGGICVAVNSSVLDALGVGVEIIVGRG